MHQEAVPGVTWPLAPPQPMADFVWSMGLFVERGGNPQGSPSTEPTA